MNHVLLIYESPEPANIEISKMLRLIEARRHLHLRQSINYKVTRKDLAWCDVIISVRGTSAMDWRLARYARQKGKYWILMLDDDFLGLDDSYGRDGEGYRVSRQRALRKLLRYVNCLLAVNKLLAEKYMVLGKIPKYVMTDTITNLDLMTKPCLFNDRTKIAFYSNDGTTKLFDQIILPVLPMLSKKYAEKLSLYLFAIYPVLDAYTSIMHIKFIPHMSYQEFKSFVAREHFDIGLAPLDDSGFSKFKYYNKYIEYTLGGTTGVYSDCPLYRQVIVNGSNGVLCENTPEKWMEAISFLIENPQCRIRYAENAQKHLVEYFGEKQIIDKLLRDIPELGDYRAPKGHAYGKLIFIKGCYWLFRVQNWGSTAFRYLRKGKMDVLLLKTRKRFRADKTWKG